MGMADAGFARRFLGLAGGFWASKGKWRRWLLLAALAAFTVGQVLVPIMTNFWSKRLFDALEQHSMQRFLAMIALAGGIMGFNVVNTVCHLTVKRRLQLAWREWLTRKVLDDWLTKGRHYQVTYLPGDHDNPDGRIAEDVRITTEYAIDLVLSLAYCAMLLGSFVNILWSLSGALDITVFDVPLHIQGYLLYIALLYAAAGSSAALLVGQPLVHTANRRQSFEADFRHGLARVREYGQAIALLHGESDERRNLLERLMGVRIGWNNQTHALGYVLGFSALYSILSTAFPYLVVAPRYIAGAITLGGLMQAAQAFQQTSSALSWPVDNLAHAAEWKASVERVLGLCDALRTVDGDASAGEADRIVVERSDCCQTLSFHNVATADPDGRSDVEPFSTQILPGERVLIAGDPAAATRLFKAVARVWTWGEGRIVLPAHTRVFVMPHRPFLPRGHLIATLAYPAEPDSLEGSRAEEALAKVGLGHLIERLYEVENWGAVLSTAEQQRLGFARLLIRRPDWIFIENATNALDVESEAEMLRLLDNEFKQATLITIGHHEALEEHHHRKLIFERVDDIVRMREEVCRPFQGGALADPEL